MKITKQNFQEMTQQMKFMGSYRHVGTWDSWDGYSYWKSPSYVINTIYDVYYGDQVVMDDQEDFRRYVFFDKQNEKVICEDVDFVYVSDDGKSLSIDIPNRQSCESNIEEHFIQDLKATRKMKLQKLMKENMEKPYSFELSVMTFKEVYPLVKFYEQFFIDENKIFLGRCLTAYPSSLTMDNCEDLVPAKICIRKTAKGLLMCTTASFESKLNKVIDWLNFIHESFPEIDFYLEYADNKSTDKGVVFTNVHEDFLDNRLPFSTLTHIKNEPYWYDLEPKKLIQKLKRACHRTKKM